MKLTFFLSFFLSFFLKLISNHNLTLPTYGVSILDGAEVVGGNYWEKGKLNALRHTIHGSDSVV